MVEQLGPIWSYLSSGRYSPRPDTEDKGALQALPAIMCYLTTFRGRFIQELALIIRWSRTACCNGYCCGSAVLALSNRRRPDAIAPWTNPPVNRFWNRGGPVSVRLPIRIWATPPMMVSACSTKRSKVAGCVARWCCRTHPSSCAEFARSSLTTKGCLTPAENSSAAFNAEKTLSFGSMSQSAVARRLPRA
jgi:hypothetical protein